MKLTDMNKLVEMKNAGSITEVYYNAVMNNTDNWIPASGGNETWTVSKSGRSYLYVWNPATKEHGWLDDTDIVHPENPYS